MNTEGFLFGCDPELFIVNEAGEAVSAHGLIPGTKAEPHKVNFGAVQVDGMAFEFNIDPASTFEEFNRNIVEVLRQGRAMLPKGHGFSIVPSVNFSAEVMDAQPPVAKEMGCDPDYNAWTGEVNPTPDTSVNPLLRTASGHLHIGWTEDMPIHDELHTRHCHDLVKQLDWYLGAPSIAKDPDVTRRQLYGKAGAYRPKPYGVEYRVLSNFWIKDKTGRQWVWNRMLKAIADMKRSELARLGSDYNNRIVEVINTGKKDEHLWDQFFFPLAKAA